jgi:hypothetical protein
VEEIGVEEIASFENSVGIVCLTSEYNPSDERKADQGGEQSIRIDCDLLQLVGFPKRWTTGYDGMRKMLGNTHGTKRRKERPLFVHTP